MNEKTYRVTIEARDDGRYMACVTDGDTAEANLVDSVIEGREWAAGYVAWARTREPKIEYEL